MRRRSRRPKHSLSSLSPGTSLCQQMCHQECQCHQMCHYVTRSVIAITYVIVSIMSPNMSPAYTQLLCESITVSQGVSVTVTKYATVSSVSPGMSLCQQYHHVCNNVIKITIYVTVSSVSPGISMYHRYHHICKVSSISPGGQSTHWVPCHQVRHCHKVYHCQYYVTKYVTSLHPVTVWKYNCVTRCVSHCHQVCHSISPGISLCHQYHQACHCAINITRYVTVTIVLKKYFSTVRHYSGEIHIQRWQCYSWFTLLGPYSM